MHDYTGNQQTLTSVFFLDCREQKNNAENWKLNDIN